MRLKHFEVVKEYNAQSDILFIHKDIEYKYRESVEMDNNVILDFDSDYRPVALEILDASKFFNVNKLSLKRHFEMLIQVQINKDVIQLKGLFKFSLHNKEYSSQFVKKWAKRTLKIVVSKDYSQTVNDEAWILVTVIEKR